MRVKRLIWREDEQRRLISSLGLPAVVAAGVFMLHMLPHEVLDFLMVWTLASFPIGVLIGHCVLREESN
jgi:hypothetical protein